MIFKKTASIMGCYTKDNYLMNFIRLFDYHLTAIDRKVADDYHDEIHLD